MADLTETDAQGLCFLASEGYLPLLLAVQDGMVEAYSELFSAAQKFFNLPEDSPQKVAFQAASGSAASEEGYSDLPGEKSIMTIKTLYHCPQVLQKHAQAAWNLTGVFLDEVTKKIALSLGLQPDVFAPFVWPCCVLPPEKRTPTLLRMFRYIRPQGEEPTVNAERHKDIGLLSLVIGHSPGLEVMDPMDGAWNAIESEDFVPQEAKAQSGGLTATLLTGQTLSLLTRGQYRAGVHRVLCAPSKETPYRFSIVFTLRPAEAPVFTKLFESEAVGRFTPNEQMNGQSSTVLLQRISSSVWNVNVAKDVREEQQKRLRNLAGAASAPNPVEGSSMAS